MGLRNRAGFPTITELGPNVLLSNTIEPAPIRQFSFIVALFKMRAPIPMKVLSPITAL